MDAFNQAVHDRDFVADGEIIRAIGDFSRTIVLFLITMLCVGTMYFLLIVQILLVGNLTVMLR